MKKEVNQASDVKSAKVEKDYSKFFDFSNAKVISEDEQGKKIRIAGRDIMIKSEPNYRQEKVRGKEAIQVLYDNSIPEELQNFGKGKLYAIFTYGVK